MKHLIPFLFAAVLVAEHASAQYQSQPTEESRKLPPGSAAERKVRMSGRANAVAYTKKFDLSGLPHYVPEENPPESFASTATTTSATRPSGDGGRRRSRRPNLESRSSTTCLRRPSPFPASTSGWRTSPSTTSPASTTRSAISA